MGGEAAFSEAGDTAKILYKTFIESPLSTLITAGIEGREIKGLKDFTIPMLTTFLQEAVRQAKAKNNNTAQNNQPEQSDTEKALALLFGGMIAAAATRKSADPTEEEIALAKKIGYDIGGGGNATKETGGTEVATNTFDIGSLFGSSGNLTIDPAEIAAYSGYNASNMYDQSAYAYESTANLVAYDKVAGVQDFEPGFSDNETYTSNWQEILDPFGVNAGSLFGGSGPAPFDIDLSILDAVEHECHLSNEAYLPENGDTLDMGAVFGSSSLSRQEQDLQVWQQAEGERLTKLYQMALDKLDGNIDPNKLTCDSRDNSETHARISEAIKYLREMIDVAPDTGYGESAVEQRDRYVKMISHNFNTENLEEARLNLVQLVAKPSVFDRTSSIKSETEKYGGISLDGDITWSNGRELVNKVNRFIDLGGKLQTLTVNAHGENNITFTDESADRISGGNRRGVVYGNSPNSLPEAANWNEIHWEGAVNNNFTLWMGSCKGSDDARAIMDIIISQNRDIEGVVAFGRNYQGHWTGGDTFFSSWNYDNWPATDGHLGLVQYEQAVDGNIIKTVIPHPASQYLIDENNNRIWNKKNEFIKTLNSSSRTFPLFVQQLALYGNRSNK
jgi:hypothetical protein